MQLKRMNEVKILVHLFQFISMAGTEWARWKCIKRSEGGRAEQLVNTGPGRPLCQFWLLLKWRTEEFLSVGEAGFGRRATRGFREETEFRTSSVSKARF